MRGLTRVVGRWPGRALARAALRWCHCLLRWLQRLRHKALHRGGAQLAAPIAGAAWPAGGLAAPLLRMVSALIQQLTQPPQGSLPQRVVAAQPWPLELAHALESGAVEGDAPLLQTWLVRQGSVLTPDGARGFALTLRAPVAWLGGQSPPLSASPPLAGAATLLVPFAGNAASLQSGVLALVLQGAEASAARTSLTSALLVLDFQPQLPAAVYGRDMLQARLDNSAVNVATATGYALGLVRPKKIPWANGWRAGPC